ncbi:DUF1657 domain-containing protein [Paenibacillus alkalitolerans]|uniref:DUF1657 domain-containing protein n=1 Tax=Paenibacillus alkalitolerans TaxID=2799335 RepID=UPI0018F5CD14|nr:DUF1657 domain-containing protein [Paenibacillus alkalitolerans]
MTVGTQVKQALANAKSVQASLEVFALQTQDEKAKQVYANAAEQMKTLIEGLESRVKQIELEEPQYKE